MRREQHVHAVEQLDAGAYGYLVSRTALLHPKGETSTSRWGCVAYSTRSQGSRPTQTRTLVSSPATSPQAWTAGDTSRQAPSRSVAWNNEDPVAGAALDAAAETMVAGDSPTDEMYIARVHLAERRMKEALLALEEADLRGASAREVERLEKVYAQELTAYRAVMRPETS